MLSLAPRNFRALARIHRTNDIGRPYTSPYRSSGRFMARPPSRNAKRTAFGPEHMSNALEQLRQQERERLRPKDVKTPPIRKATYDDIVGDPFDERESREPRIDTRVPFLQTSVYHDWVGVIRVMWESAIDSVSVSLNNWALRKFAPHITKALFDNLDAEVDKSIAMLAEAMETGNLSLVEPLMDPLLYSLLQDNFAEFTHTNQYRLAVKDIQSKRIGMKVSWLLPPFGNETPSGISLWGGNAIEFTQPAPSQPLKDTLQWMSQAVGTSYALVRREKVVAERPAEMHEVPIPKRFWTHKNIKKRVTAHLTKPLTGDVVSLVKYLLAMRRLGFNYVLRRGIIKLEVAYGFECTHNLSVFPIVEEPADAKLEAVKSKEEKAANARARRLKYPEFKDKKAPHIILFSAKYPMHSDSTMLKPTPWTIFDVDSMRSMESYEVGEVARLSALSPDDIERQLPALRIASKDFFTKFGPRREWFLELERLRRVAINRAKTGDLSDPRENALLDSERFPHLLDGKHPYDANTILKQLFQPRNKAEAKEVPSGPDSNSPGVPLGNIFDLAKEPQPRSNSPQSKDSKKL